MVKIKMKSARSRRLQALLLGSCTTRVGAFTFSTTFYRTPFVDMSTPINVNLHQRTNNVNLKQLQPSSRLYAKRPRKKIKNPDEVARPKGFQSPEPDGLKEFRQGTMDTALCIVPPDEAWDDIQRARHFAKDPSFYTWPPAIRLFHPFVDRSTLTEVASSIAEMIEKYELESFDITIDKLLIVPHFEDLQEHEEARRQLPDQAKISEVKPTEDEERVQALIKDEELKGKKKLAKRNAREKAMNKLKGKNDASAQKEGDEVREPSRKDQSPKEILKEQRKNLTEFNGPCVLCLEPDDESKIHIQAFREILRKKMFMNYDPFSPSSTVTNPDTLLKGLPRSILKQHGLLGKSKKIREGVSFRPAITLGRFSTVTKAVEVAKKLQQVWEPLTFRVTDLQLVSKLEPSSFKSTAEGESADEGSSDPYSIHVDKNGTPSLLENRELTLRKFHGSDGSGSILTTKGEFGCDAMVMLQGEEGQLLQKPSEISDVGNDDCEEDEGSKEAGTSFYLEKEDEEKIMELLLSPAAIPGGQGNGRGASSDGDDADDDDDDDDDDYLQNWLEEDEDIDDGATIIIGRTQFFMGEMRQYTGMPASSTMDGKDRVMGDNEVSGSARRRGAVHRQGDRWREGDYGRKEKDYLP